MTTLYKNSIRFCHLLMQLCKTFPPHLRSAVAELEEGLERKKFRQVLSLFSHHRIRIWFAFSREFHFLQFRESITEREIMGLELYSEMG